MSDLWKSIARLLIISALIAPLHAHLQNAAKPAIIHGPYLQNPTGNSVTVIWFTNEACTSWVEYGTGESLSTFPKFGSVVGGQGTSLRLATRPWLVSTGEYGGSGPPGKARGPGRRGKGTLAHGVDHLTRLWGPLLNEGGIDLAISGHYHRLFKFDPEPGKNAFPIIGGPQDAFIRADVTTVSIDLKVIDIKGNTLETLTVPSKKK